MSDAPRKIKFNFETVGSITAMVIGACALFVAWDQAQIMRKQQHASVIPIVNVAAGFSSTAEGHTLSVNLRNNGIGPAIIESAHLAVNGRDVTDWADLRERFLPEGLRSGYQSSLDTALGVLAAGEQSETIRLYWPLGDEADKGFDALRADVLSSGGERAAFSVCYCSVFDRCWRSGEGQYSKPQPVKRCDDAGEDVVARLLQSISREPVQ